MDKYSIIAISMILVIGLFLTFSSEEVDSESYDYVGLVSNIEKSSKGYTFDFIMENETIRCYYTEQPLSDYYKIKGEFSDDGKIFFVSSMCSIT